MIGLSVALSGLWALSLWGLTTLLTPHGWWGTAVVIASAVTVLAGTGLALTRLPRWLVLTTAGAAGFALWLARFAGSGQLRGWIEDPVLQFDRLQGEVLRGVAPMEPTPTLQDAVLLLVWVWTVAAIVVLSGFVRPGHEVPGALAAALLIVLPPLFVPLVTNQAPSTGLLFGMMVLVAAVVWLASARGGVSAAVAAGCAAALAAGAFAVVPEVRTPSWNRGVQYAPVGGYVDDVTIELAQDLQSGSTVPVLTLTSDQVQPVYLRLATLSRFEDGTWLPDDEVSSEGVSVGEERVMVAPSGAAASDGVAALDGLAGGQRDEQGRILVTTETSEVRFSAETGRLIGIRPIAPELAGVAFEFEESERQFVDISIAALRSSWLPLPSGATQVVESAAGEFDFDEWIWAQNAATATASDTMTKRGESYRAMFYPWGSVASRSLLRELPPELLQVFPEMQDAPSNLRPFLALPGELPQSMEDVRAEVSNLGLDRVSTAFALEQYFRQFGGFTYDEAAPYLPGADAGSPFSVMDAFMTVKSGYCVHFATTFAALARSLGVPTRVAVGYAARAQGETPISVRGKELHAWPEIYVEHVGWIPFEPTPGGAGLRAQGGGIDSAPIVSPGTPEDVSTDTEVPEAAEDELVGENRPLADEELAGEPDPAARAASDGSTRTRWVVTGLSLAGLLMLLAAPAFVRASRRTCRLRAIRHGNNPAGRAWDEFGEMLRDYGRTSGPGASGIEVLPRSRTPEALVAAVCASGALASDKGRAAAALIALTVNSERYAPAGTPLTVGAAASVHSRGGGLEASADKQLIGEQLIDALEAVAAELHAGASRRERLRARWLPASLFT